MSFFSLVQLSTCHSSLFAPIAKGKRFGEMSFTLLPSVHFLPNIVLWNQHQTDEQTQGAAKLSREGTPLYLLKKQVSAGTIEETPPPAWTFELIFFAKLCMMVKM